MRTRDMQSSRETESSLEAVTELSLRNRKSYRESQGNRDPPKKRPVDCKECGSLPCSDAEIVDQKQGVEESKVEKIAISIA